MQGRCSGCTVGMGGSCGTTPTHPQYAPCIQAELLSNLPPEQPHAICTEGAGCPFVQRFAAALQHRVSALRQKSLISSRW